MILHITTEMLSENFGGISTVVSELYRNRKQSENFLFIGERRERPSNLPSDIHYLHIEEYLNLKSLSQPYELVFFHSFSIVKKFSDVKKSVFVVHSNIWIEKNYSEFIPNQSLDGFAAALMNADEIACVSNYELNILHSKIKNIQNPISQKKIVRVINGIEKRQPSLPRPADIRPRGTYGYIGRMDTRKGAFNLVADFPEQGQLLMAFGGSARFFQSDYRKLCLLINQRSVRNIFPIGYCTGERKQAFFSRVQAVIIASLYEPFGMTVLEALQAGRVPLACNHGGPREILGEDYPFYFDVSQPQTLSKAIEKLESDPKLAQDFLNLKAPAILERYSVEKMLESYRKI